MFIVVQQKSVGFMVLQDKTGRYVVVFYSVSAYFLSFRLEAVFIA